MKVNYKVNDRTVIDCDVKDMKQAFDFIAYADSVFKVTHCGNCESTNLKFETRNPKGFIYRSVVCNDCKHTLKISEQKPEKGGKMYPDREWMEPYSGGDDNSGGRSRDDSDDYNQDREPVGAGSNGNGRGDIPF